MIRIIRKLTICMFLFIIYYTSCFAVESVPKEVIEATNSVYRVATIGKSDFLLGSSFIICIDNEKTYLATNYHVINNKRNDIYIIDRDGEEKEATLFAYDEKLDIAILRIDSILSGKALQLNQKDITKGEPIYAIGFPADADIVSESLAYNSDDATITDGIISSIRDGKTADGADSVMIQVTAPINSGNSGGPLFNRFGEVIGINTYSATDSQGINWAISVEKLIDIMTTNDLQVKMPDTHSYKEEAKSSSFSPIIVASMVAFFFVVVAIVVVYNINREKGIICKKCGFKNGDNSFFCRKCGESLSSKIETKTLAKNSVENSQIKYCRKCGNKLYPNATFCNKCGNKIN